ncbi:MAG: flagellar motor protein MotD [SAR86 cluster bacterium]|uniref:Flagellar motor protein MotD n=1 Tax=SAR86 cluster bacterium TaxID=2030880 RepID=A0A2A4XHM7_9GAMM|nr:MAG: flagellar motor protein MotD [SAR86 cluster bacterium]
MARKRKRKQAEPENHERWLVSYADFITLLFAFFVVMYSMSSVNEGKYRVLSDSMTAAFTQTTRSLAPIQAGEVARSSSSVIKPIRKVPDKINISAPIVLLNAGPEIIVDPEYQDQEEAASEAIAKQIDDIASDIEDEFEEMIADENVSVRKSPFWLEVVFNSNILFASASAELSTGARVELGKLGKLLQEYENSISVEGFTDNIPIISPIFPSNWELSSARAAAVVRLFEEYGVESARLISVGYGENRSVSENHTAEGRANNRRVVIVIMAKVDQAEDMSRVGYDDSELFRRRVE